MRGVPKIFEYLKSTNVGESVDPNSPDTRAARAAAGGDGAAGEDQAMLAFGYDVYNGLQLNFDHATDKSIAHVLHRDVDLENHPSLTEHGHDGDKETEFDAHVFDSQFKRYA
jgi:hypothetical protein